MTHVINNDVKSRHVNIIEFPLEKFTEEKLFKDKLKGNKRGLTKEIQGQKFRIAINQRF